MATTTTCMVTNILLHKFKLTFSMYLVRNFDHNKTTLIHAIMPSWVLAGLFVAITNDYYYIIISCNLATCPHG